MADDGTPPRDAARTPVRVRLPGFVDDEIGLGDLVKRVTRTAMPRPCSGCERRAAALNRWLVLTGRRRPH
ncbi:hypothetical protein ACFWIN_33145 [Streptomyces sp. NPDC127049]|uniref:hypothetical protein n=1 Tax=Streptomyces sp. NPDC127049 TaxID=3347118 RepID=UPI003653F4BE